MRLGEILKTLEPVINDNGELVVGAEQIYNGQAFIVRRYAKLVRALDVVSGQAWNKLDLTSVESIKKTYGTSAQTANLSQEDYAALVAYVNALNQTLPVFVGLLDSLVEPQDEQCINVKLPERLSTLNAL